jgi:hypothetical protein
MLSACLTANRLALSPAARSKLSTLQSCGTGYHNSGGEVHARRLMAPNAESVIVPVRLHAHTHLQGFGYPAFNLRWLKSLHDCHHPIPTVRRKLRPIVWLCRYRGRCVFQRRNRLA